MRGSAWAQLEYDDPLERVTLAASAVTTTRLGLGCAGLLRLASRKQRQELLATTFQAGIRHFDVARMYGLGAAEGELGRFVRSRRDQLTIATKFGIEAPEATMLTRLQGPARALIGRYPALRRLVRRHPGAFRQPHQYDVATARSSLERSLRELRTDYVDILFVHDPRDEDDVVMEDLRGFLEDARQAGRIRSWGVSGEPEPISFLRAGCSDDAVIQVRDDILSRETRVLRTTPPHITFGLLSSALPRIVSHVAASEGVRRRWSDAVAADCSDPAVVASLLLRDGLLSNSGGVVLFGTTKPENVRVAATASELAEDPALCEFQRLVRAELAEAPERRPGQ
jgi:hypothetical protein